MKITILVPKYCEPASVTALLEVFNKCQFYFEFQSPNKVVPKLFEIELVGEKTEVQTYNQFPIKCDKTLQEVITSDLVIIPALGLDIEKNIKANVNMIPFIRRLHHQGAVICSICTGAFLLASADLGENLKMTSHWYFEPIFKKMFPHIDYQSGAVIVDNGRILSSGGVTSVYNMGLYIIEKHFGAQLATGVARVMLVDKDRVSQNPYSLFIGNKSHQDQEILKAQFLMEGNYQENISIQQICKQVSVGERNFNRRFKKAVGMLPLEYLQRVRIEAAKYTIEHTDVSISEVASQVGYQDKASFRRIFKRMTDMTPSDYRRKYRS